MLGGFNPGGRGQVCAVMQGSSISPKLQTRASVCRERALWGWGELGAKLITAHAGFPCPDRL